MEFIIVVPDIVTRSSDCVSAAGLTEVASSADCANVLILPAACTASRTEGGRFGHVRGGRTAGVVAGEHAIPVVGGRSDYPIDIICGIGGEHVARLKVNAVSRSFHSVTSFESRVIVPREANLVRRN